MVIVLTLIIPTTQRPHAIAKKSWILSITSIEIIIPNTARVGIKARGTVARMVSVVKSLVDRDSTLMIVLVSSPVISIFIRLAVGISVLAGVSFFAIVLVIVLLSMLVQALPSDTPFRGFLVSFVYLASLL